MKSAGPVTARTPRPEAAPPPLLPSPPDIRRAATALFVAFVGTAAAGWCVTQWAGGGPWRPTLGWKASQFFFNYQDLGFVKRALVGSVLHPFPALQTAARLYALSCAFVAAFCAVFAAEVARATAKLDRRDRHVLLAVIISSPALFTRFGFDMGRFDVLGLLAMLLSFAAIDRGRLGLAGVLSSVALLSHEAYAVLGLPLVVAYEVRRCGRSFRPAAALLALPAVTFAALMLWGRYEAGLPALETYFAHSRPYIAVVGAVDSDAIEVLTRGWRDNFDYTVQMFWEKRAFVHLPIIAGWGWLVTWFFARFYRLNQLRRDGLFYASFTPVLLSVIACDYYRWVSLAAINMLFVVLLQCRTHGALKVPRGTATSVLIGTCLLGPISNTKSFPIFFELLERTFHLHLAW